jgi:exonuclease VII small subunit
VALRLNDIEAAFRLKADQGLKALDGIVEKSKAADRGLKGLTDTANKVGAGLIGLGGTITAAFAFAIRGAAAEAESLAQLEGTVNSTGASFEKQRGRIDSFIQTLAQTTKFSDDQLIPALNRAILATNDVDKGFRAAELGAKIAAAGFGSLETNSTLIARLMNGQATAIGRLIPEFRDLDERLEAGATEAGIAAEALARLNAIAANAPSPQPLQQLTKAVGELGDAVGATALESITPFVVGLTKGVEAVEAFAKTTSGRVVTNVVLIAGVIATLAGGLLLLVGQLATAAAAIGAAGGFTLALSAASAAGGVLAAVFSPAGAVIAGLIALAVFVAKASIELNKLSKASDEARDKAFAAPRLAQFNAELNDLKGTLKQLEDGTLSITEAQKEFNRFGLQTEEQARQRIDTLGQIVARLGEEATAQKDAAKADADRLAADAEGKRIAATIAALEAEKQKRIELEVLQEKFAALEQKRGEALVAKTVPGVPEPPPQEGFADAGLKELTAPGPVIPPGTIEDLTTTEDLFKSNAEAAAALARADEDLTASLEAAAAPTQAANEQAQAFEKTLLNLTAAALDGAAALAANFAVDLASGFQNAGENAKRFFQQLISDVTRAIAKALILQAIIGAVGGGSRIGRILGGLFQDPTADQQARFEGQRFVDLFFQGVTREMGNARDRIDASLTENRQLVENRGRATSVIVTEASPETTVEFTDRKVEPRVRARARQRTGTTLDAVGNPN